MTVPTRPEAVAGQFYPADPERLAAEVDAYIDGANVARYPGACAAIAPHAGYVYSGAIAGSVYRAIAERLSNVNTVILIGPSHRVAFAGVALSAYRAFASPLGVVPIRSATYTRLQELPQVHVREDAHAAEHGLEVHLPFLTRVMDQPFSIVPLVVGQCSPRETAEVIDVALEASGPASTFVLISSDLSHFHDHTTATQLDAATSQAIASYDIDRITPTDACGAAAIRGYLYSTRSDACRVEVLDVRNSGDTAGSKDRVVGYGAYVFI